MVKILYLAASAQESLDDLWHESSDHSVRQVDHRKEEGTWTLCGK